MSIRRNSLLPGRRLGTVWKPALRPAEISMLSRALTTGVSQFLAVAERPRDDSRGLQPTALEFGHFVLDSERAGV